MPRRSPRPPSPPPRQLPLATPFARPSPSAERPHPIRTAPLERKGHKMTTESPTAPAAAKRGGARVGVQRFGTFLSGMIMPNIGAFIAWGLITAMFIPTGWFGENSPVAAWQWANAPNLGGGETPDGSVWPGLVGRVFTYRPPLL